MEESNNNTVIISQLSHIWSPPEKLKGIICNLVWTEREKLEMFRRTDIFFASAVFMVNLIFSTRWRTRFIAAEPHCRQSITMLDGRGDNCVVVKNPFGFILYFIFVVWQSRGHLKSRLGFRSINDINMRIEVINTFKAYEKVRPVRTLEHVYSLKWYNIMSILQAFSPFKLFN